MKMENGKQTMEKLAGNASESTRRRNPALFGALPPVVEWLGRKPAETAKADADGRKTERAMTKTEERFLAWLKANTDAATTLVIPQPTRLFRFANGDTYTPDFLVIEDRGDDLKSVTAWEVKGGYRGAGWDQGYERYKRAREQFGKYAAFRMATWDRCLSQWSIE